jgi:hypothetical protein
MAGNVPLAVSMFAESMTTRSTPMLKHHSLGSASSVSTGRIFEARDRRSETTKTLLLPKRRIAWVALLNEQLSPVRLRSGRIALIGNVGMLGDIAAKRLSTPWRRLYRGLLIIAITGFALMLANSLFAPRHNVHDAQAAISASRPDGTNVADSQRTKSLDQCSVERAVQSQIKARKLYVLKMQLSRRFFFSFDSQSIIGGLAKSKVLACNRGYIATFVRSQQGWQLAELTKD